MKPMVTLFSLLFLAHSALSAAELKGTVRDAETGESLPGANVYIEGVERGASTDLDGQFAIANVGAGHDAASARVFLGLGRRWNISLSYDY